MNMHWFDWAIIVGFFLFITVVATYTRKYVKGVADFLAANRCAGRYLLTVSEAVASLGAISLIAWYEAGLDSGLTFLWWTNFNTPVVIFTAITGWVVYRYRRTRCLTLPEFLERRYSKKFRIFSGFIIFISGILNMGIFPAIGAKFFMYFCGFPSHEVQVFGWLRIDLVFALVMAILLIVSLYFTYMGGQIAITLTDFIQGLFTTYVFGIIALVVLLYVGWEPIKDVFLGNPQLGLDNAQTVHMVHPMMGDGIKSFNAWYFFMFAVITFYMTRVWQGNQGYNASARTPHEAKMGGIVAVLRTYTILMVTFLLPVLVYVILRHPSFSHITSQINPVLDKIGDENVRTQMTVPVTMSVVLSKGLVGCFAAVFLAAFISTHDTYLHSWGSIFIQDVVMPFRKKPFTVKQHMHLLRLAILGVAVFIFIFSLVWTQTGAILLWFQLTGAIWLGGGGAVMIGGLYWKKGTTRGAYCAVIAGAVFALTGIVAQQVYKHYRPDGVFPLNGMQMAFVAAIFSCLVYAIVSLSERGKFFNLDKLLHLGDYAVTDDVVEGGAERRGIFSRIFSKLGLTSEFNKRDKFLFFFSVCFSCFMFSIFLFGTLYNIILKAKTGSYASPEAWMRYWKYYIAFVFVLVVVYSVWMTIGGCMDVKKMFARLRELKRDEHDDGWVTQDNDNKDIS